MLGGSVRILMKSNQFQLSEGQNHFSTSWHANMMSLPSMNRYGMFFVKTSHNLQACTAILTNLKAILRKQPTYCEVTMN